MRIAVACALALLVGACGKSEKTDGSDALGSATPPVEKTEPANGPFGIAMGTPISKLKATALENAGVYEVTKVPRSHPDIESVVVQAFPETGVCYVKGIGFTQTNDSTGTQARIIADRLAEQLSTKYGKPEKTDRCISYLCREGYSSPDHWTMQVMEGERGYLYEWSPPANADGVSQVFAGVQAEGVSKTYVIVEYSLSNKAKCEEAVKKAGAASL